MSNSLSARADFRHFYHRARLARRTGGEFRGFSATAVAAENAAYRSSTPVDALAIPRHLSGNEGGAYRRLRAGVRGRLGDLVNGEYRSFGWAK